MFRVRKACSSLSCSRPSLSRTSTLFCRYIFAGNYNPAPYYIPLLSRMASTLPKFPIFQAISGHDPKSTVVVHSASGRRFTYGDLLGDVAEAKDKLLALSETRCLKGERIAFLVENSYDYVGAQFLPKRIKEKSKSWWPHLVTLLSIIGAKAVALPLSPAFPAHEIQYILDQSQASLLLSSKKFEAKAEEVLSKNLKGNPKHVKLEKKLGGGNDRQITFEESADEGGGMMLYTSGTTSRPVSFIIRTAYRGAELWRRKESCFLRW